MYNNTIGGLIGDWEKIKHVFSLKVDASTSQTVFKFYKETIGLLDTYDKKRFEVLNKYGNISDDRSEFLFDGKDKEEKANKKIKKLLDSKVNIEKIDVSSLSCLEINIVDLYNFQVFTKEQS